MNLREGTRRLALLLGVVGAILGGYFSFLYLQAGDAPAGWEYLLGTLFPILGFFIPWGAIRAIGWVVAGFIHPSG